MGCILSSYFRWKFSTFRRGAALLSLSWLVTIKDMLGIEPIRLDKDPLKEKIKQVYIFVLIIALYYVGWYE